MEKERKDGRGESEIGRGERRLTKYFATGKKKERRKKEADKNEDEEDDGEKES